MADVEELEVEELDLDEEDFSCEVGDSDDECTAVESEVSARTTPLTPYYVDDNITRVPLG